MSIAALSPSTRSAASASAPRSGRLAARLALVAAGAFFSLAGVAHAEPREVGLWYDDTGKGAVEIFACGTKLCGRIAWLKDPFNAKGEPLTDGYNPDPAMRARPICGLQVLGGLARQPDGSWDEGWVYDPKVGKSYDAALQRDGKDLILTGYKGIRLLSKSFTWTKAPQNLPLCDSATTAAR